MTNDTAELDGGASHARVIARSRDGRSFVRRHVVSGQSMILKALVHDSAESSLEQEAEWFRRGLAGDPRAEFVAVHRIGGKLVLRLPDLGAETLHEALLRLATRGRRLSSAELRELGRALFAALNRLSLAGVEHRALDATHVVLDGQAFDRVGLVGFKHARSLDDEVSTKNSSPARSDVEIVLDLLFAAATYHDPLDPTARRAALRQLDRDDAAATKDARRLARFFVQHTRVGRSGDPFVLGQEWVACFESDSSSTSPWPIPRVVDSSVLAATFGALRFARSHECVVVPSDLEPGLTLSALRIRPAWSTTPYGRAYVRGIARSILERLIASGAVTLRESFHWGRPFPWFARTGMELAANVTRLRDLIGPIETTDTT